MPAESGQEKHHRVFINNFIGGLGWVLGVTVGVALLAFILTVIMNALGGVPVIGSGLASLIKATLDALGRK
jgi:hypothetical protein